MNAEEKARLVDIITATAEVLNRQLSPVAIGLYVKAVEDLPFEKISSAMSELIRTKKFFPSPADIRELVTGSEPAIEDKAIIECAKVAVAVRNHGHYRAVVFDDPVTMAVIRQIFGGWWRLCRGLSDHDAKYWKRDFTRGYVAFARQGIRAGGILSGEHKCVPLLIGDQEKARQVMEGYVDENSDSGFPEPKLPTKSKL